MAQRLQITNATEAAQMLVDGQHAVPPEVLQQYIEGAVEKQLKTARRDDQRRIKSLENTLKQFRKPNPKNNRERSRRPGASNPKPRPGGNNANGGQNNARRQQQEGQQVEEPGKDSTRKNNRGNPRNGRSRSRQRNANSETRRDRRGERSKKR